MTLGPTDFRIGTHIREYEVLELLGKGGMGSVYRARHTYLEEERAIKIIHGRHTSDTGFVDRFIREGRILTRLRHPNLLQLFEFGTLDEGSFFMVMELIRGESVWQRLKRVGKIPIPEAIQIVREAACGLQFAHDNGIIHRDISPDNLVVLSERQGEITKVIDFGIAKPLMENAMHLTASNLFIGKPQYCSPEQCMLSETKRVLDARSDLYSLAVTFYQMLTGNLPFHSKTAQGYFLKHAHELPDPPSTHFPPGSFPEILDRAVLKAMAKRREDRYQTLGEWIADLDAFSNKNVTTVPLFSEPGIGEMFAGRYSIEKKLGRGEMGMVFKAVDKILEIPVALKTISPDISEDEKILARFKREVILARKVSHGNVCRVYDIGENAGIHYVSMEFVEGRTLAEYLRSQGSLSVEAAIPLLQQVLYAIGETHRAGIIHRDLKPQNIMVDSQMRLKIMDFGISLSPDFSRITQTGSLIGTPHYMAPEVFEGKPVDPCADLYSLGVLMYSLLTGRLPFDGPTPVAVMYAHLKADPLKPSEILPSFPPALERILLKLLQKEPQNRYATADEVLNDLKFFSEPASDSQSQSSEQLAHKLIAEHKYGKAIKLLQSLLKAHPGHAHWKKLLQGAILEKTKRDIRRTRRLIRSGNWIQAEFCLERIGAAQLEITGILSQVNGLQERLIAGKKQAVDRFLSEAQDRLSSQDYLGAMARLESAWHLQPNDPAIIQMQERIQTAQQNESHQKQETILQQARSLILDGKDEEAFLLAQEVLNEDSSHKGAKALRDQILESRWEQMQSQIIASLELAIQPLAFCDFGVSANLLEQLQKNLEIESCRREIERLRTAVLSMEASFEAEQFYDVTAIVKHLLAKDPFGWLEPYRSVFDEIETIAAGRLDQRQSVIRDSLLEAKRLTAERSFSGALDKVDSVLRQWNVPEAKELREEIVQAHFDDRLEEANSFAAALEWEQAIACWKELLDVQPDSPHIAQRITAAEEQIQKELAIQKKLLQELKQCYSFVLKGEWVEAQQLTESMLKAIQPGYRLIEMESEIEKLQTEILLHNRDQQRELETVSNQLNEARNFYKKGACSEALAIVERILETEHLQDEALELKIAIEKTIQSQASSARFQSAIQKGKEHFESRSWQKAIEFLKKACALSNESYVRDWIEQAEKNLKKERQIRLSILAMLAEADELIFYQRFTEADQKLEKCRKALSNENAFQDLAARVDKLTEKLKQEIEKEDATRALVQAEMEEVSLLYHDRLFVQALERVERILSQQPELAAAIQWKEQIQAAEAANNNVLEILKTVVKVVLKRDTKNLPNLLLRLKEAARQTPYAEDCRSIVEEFPLLVLEVESGAQQAATERLDRMFRRSLLLLEYEQLLRDFVSFVEIRSKKEAALEQSLTEGLVSLEAGDRKAALECLHRFHSIFTGRKGAPKQLDRAAITSDEGMKLSEFELESLQHSLMKHEVASMIRAAQEAKQAGDKKQAEDILLRALRIDPENIEARDALKMLEGDR